MDYSIAHSSDGSGNMAALATYLRFQTTVEATIADAQK
jgi:hypothetical protein